MRRAGNSAGCGRDREKRNVTEAMVQIRERSRRARRTGNDGEESCDHVHNTARGWCPARHQDEAASAAVLAKCLSARTENSARSSRTCRLRTQSKSR